MTEQNYWDAAFAEVKGCLNLERPVECLSVVKAKRIWEADAALRPLEQGLASLALAQCRSVHVAGSDRDVRQPSGAAGLAAWECHAQATRSYSH